MPNTKKQLSAVSEMTPKPTISIYSSMLPEIKNWKVGKEYDIKNLKIKLNGIHEGYDNKKELCANCEIISISEDEEQED